MTTILDGALIAILGIAVIVGLAKGFIKSIWGLVTVAAIVACLFFASPPITKIVVEKTNIQQSIAKPTEKLYAKITGMDTVLHKDTLEDSFALLKQNGAPSSLVNLMKKHMTGAVTEQGITAKALLASKTADMVLMLGVGIVLIIALGIILLIIKSILVSFSRILIIRPIDKILGIVYCVAITSVVLLALGGLAYTLSGQGFMNSINTAAQSSKVFKYIYSDNPLQSIFNKYVNLGDILAKIKK